MKLALCLAIALAAVGCSRSDQSVNADNTQKNERDRNGGMLTPADQGESDSDRNITKTIRQSVFDNDQLSVTAKNVKIITTNGVVTLRGPVASQDEKATIESAATRAVGVRSVDDQLEVEGAGQHAER